MVAAEFVGWLMKKLEFNLAALVMSFVLAGGAEEAFRQSLILSDNGLLIFVMRPVALAFIVLGLVAVVMRARTSYRSSRMQALQDT